MRDEDKPFICYKSGWSMKIVPRNAAGWRALLWWMFALGIGTALFVWWVARIHSERYALWGTGAFLVATVAWALAMIWWMKARSEIVDANELLELKRERDGDRRGKR